MTAPGTIDWLDPRSLLVPQAHLISAPTPIPSWLHRAFGGADRVPRSTPLPRTGIEMYKDRTGRTVFVAWSADHQAGPPLFQSLQLYTWIRHAIDAGRLPPDGCVNNWSNRAYRKISGIGETNKFYNQELRASFTRLSGVTYTRVSPTDRSSVTREDAEHWVRRIGHAPLSSRVQTRALLDVGFESMKTSGGRSRTNVTTVRIDPDILHPLPEEPLTWIDPHWDANLDFLSSRMLHRLMDPDPHFGADDPVVSMSYADLKDLLGLPQFSQERIGRLHDRFVSMGAELKAAGWFREFYAERPARFTTTQRLYCWTASDRLMAVRALAAMDLETLPYGDRPVAAGLLVRGVRPQVVRQWIRDYATKRLRDLLLYAQYREESKAPIRSVENYIEKALSAGGEINTDLEFPVWYRNRASEILSELGVQPAVVKPEGEPSRPPLSRQVRASIKVAPERKVAPTDQGSENLPSLPSRDKSLAFTFWLATHASSELRDLWSQESHDCSVSIGEDGCLVLDLTPTAAEVIARPGMRRWLAEAAWDITKQRQFLCTVQGEIVLSPTVGQHQPG